eukprot:70429-Rhodomonas_salina.1
MSGTDTGRQTSEKLCLVLDFINGVWCYVETSGTEKGYGATSESCFRDRVLVGADLGYGATDVRY